MDYITLGKDAWLNVRYISHWYVEVCSRISRILLAYPVPRGPTHSDELHLLRGGVLSYFTVTWQCTHVFHGVTWRCTRVFHGVTWQYTHVFHIGTWLRTDPAQSEPACRCWPTRTEIPWTRKTGSRRYQTATWNGRGKTVSRLDKYNMKQIWQQKLPNSHLKWKR